VRIENKWFVLISVGVGTFMTALDGSVANTILPVIEGSLKSDVTTIEWVVTVYLLVVSGLLLTFGRLGDLRGHKRTYIAGFVLFVLGSASSGLAPSDWLLITFRGFQAIGGAMLLANSPAILTGNFPASQRGQALGLQATMTYLGLTAGPALGGWLAQSYSWRAVFFINVPVGLLALLLSTHFIPRDEGVEVAQGFDRAGAVTFMIGLVGLMLALNQGAEWGWGSPLILGLIFASLVILAVFVRVELRVPAPMLDLSLFSRRIFSSATISAVFNYVSLYCIIFLLPFYLIQGRGMDPAQAGLLLTAQPLVMAVAAPLSGTLSDRIGSRIPATLGLALVAVGLFLLSRLGPHTPIYFIAIYLGIAGLGAGIFVSPNTSALMGDAPHNRQGIASGILATARNVGMVLGVGMAGAFLISLAGNDNPPASSLIFAVNIGLLAGAIAAAIGSLIAVARGREGQFSVDRRQSTVDGGE
jgi:EmrB/QacA subfamily drug resistance transporter